MLYWRSVAHGRLIGYHPACSRTKWPFGGPALKLSDKRRVVAAAVLVVAAALLAWLWWDWQSEAEPTTHQPSEQPLNHRQPTVGERPHATIPSTERRDSPDPNSHQHKELELPEPPEDESEAGAEQELDVLFRVGVTLMVGGQPIWGGGWRDEIWPNYFITGDKRSCPDPALRVELWRQSKLVGYAEIDRWDLESSGYTEILSDEWLEPDEGEVSVLQEAIASLGSPEWKWKLIGWAEENRSRGPQDFNFHLPAPRVSRINDHRSDFKTANLLDFGEVSIDFTKHFGGRLGVGRMIKPGSLAGVMLPSAFVLHTPQDRQDSWTDPVPVFSRPDGRFWFPLPRGWMANERPLAVMCEASASDWSEADAKDSTWVIQLQEPDASIEGVLDYGEIGYPFGTIELGVDRAPEMWPEGGPPSDAVVDPAFDNCNVLIDRELSLLVGMPGSTTQIEAAALFDSLDAYRLETSPFEPPQPRWEHHQSLLLRPTWGRARRLIVTEFSNTVVSGYYDRSDAVWIPNRHHESLSLREPTFVGFGGWINEVEFPKSIPGVPLGGKPEVITVATDRTCAKMFTLVPGETGDIRINLDQPLQELKLELSMAPLSGTALEHWQAITQSMTGENRSLPLNFYFRVLSRDNPGWLVELRPGETTSKIVSVDPQFLAALYWEAEQDWHPELDDLLFQFPLVKGVSIPASSIIQTPPDSLGLITVRFPEVPAPSMLALGKGWSSRQLHLTCGIDLSSITAVAIDTAGNRMRDWTDHGNMPSFIVDGSERIPVSMTIDEGDGSVRMGAILPTRLELHFTWRYAMTFLLVSARLDSLESKLPDGQPVGTLIEDLAHGRFRDRKNFKPIELWTEPGTARLVISYRDFSGDPHQHIVPVEIFAGRVQRLTVDLDELSELPHNPMPAESPRPTPTDD